VCGLRRAGPGADCTLVAARRASPPRGSTVPSPYLPSPPLGLDVDVELLNVVFCHPHVPSPPHPGTADPRVGRGRLPARRAPALMCTTAGRDLRGRRVPPRHAGAGVVAPGSSGSGPRPRRLRPVVPHLLGLVFVSPIGHSRPDLACRPLSDAAGTTSTRPAPLPEGRPVHARLQAVPAVDRFFTMKSRGLFRMDPHHLPRELKPISISTRSAGFAEAYDESGAPFRSRPLFPLHPAASDRTKPAPALIFLHGGGGISKATPGSSRVASERGCSRTHLAPGKLGRQRGVPAVRPRATPPRWAHRPQQVHRGPSNGPGYAATRLAARASVPSSSLGLRRGRAPGFNGFWVQGRESPSSYHRRRRRPYPLSTSSAAPTS
jgi:hypothetical protein